MGSLIIRGAKIEDWLVYNNTTGQVAIDIRMRADWTDVVCKEMGWTEDPGGFKAGGLEGTLFGVSMLLTPAGDGSMKVKDYELDVKISTVGKFKHIPETEGGKVIGRQIGFEVTSIDEDAIGTLFNWMKFVGPSAVLAQCKVTYSQEKQGTLGETAADVPPAGGPEKARGRKKAAVN